MKAIHSTIIFVTIVSMLVITSCSKSTTNNPTLLSPANASANIPSNQLFTCSTVSNALTYQFVFTDANTGISFQSPAQVGNTYTPSLLISGRTYTWHVFVQISSTNSLETQTWSFSMQ